MKRTLCSVLLGLLLLTAVAGAEEIIWFDGSRDPGGPPGKLLTDNEGYWGESVLTGVDYTYQYPPDNPADILKEDASKFGRRLLDGYYSGNWWAPVGISGRPLVVTLDFKRLCRFSEVDIVTRSRKVNVSIEVSADKSVWKQVGKLSTKGCVDSTLQRIRLPERPSGRYVKLTIDAGGITYLDEVIAWGNSDQSDPSPEYLRPVVAPAIANGIALESIPGIKATACADAQFFHWKNSLGKVGARPAVWSKLETWGCLTDKPVLPDLQSIGKPIEIVMARNESECAAVALTNTSINLPAKLRVTLSEFTPVSKKGDAKGLSGDLRVGGAIPSRWHGIGIGPLFSADNMLGKSHMQRYLTNGAGIMGFPEIELSPAGSAVLWLTIRADMAKPGLYEAKLAYKGGSPQLVRVKVVDVKLPEPAMWLQSWSGTTGMFPFEHADRRSREVGYKTSLGINVWDGFPEKATLPEAARGKCKAIYRIWGVGDYGHKIYSGSMKPDEITPAVEKEVAEMIRGHVSKARELGLGYDQWYVELADEPCLRNTEIFGAFCKLIRKIDPKVRIYCNPSFWVGFENGGVTPDAEVYRTLAPWYNDCVDISCPLVLLLEDRPKSAKLFGHKRLVNAFYNVASHQAKSEKREIIEEYRRYGWRAKSLGYNGWGFYSYYGPRGNPWDDFDSDFMTSEDLPDYEVVYPGPRGPIPTRAAEAFREGWEDYRLLTLLSSKNPSAFSALIKNYKAGEPIEKLRLKALEKLSEGR